MNVELIPSVQAGHLPVGIMPVPPDAPDPTEFDWPPGDYDTRVEMKGAEAAERLWPRIFPGL
jgi:hypothetical protein